jgi:small subunit ribosomal protein S20
MTPGTGPTKVKKRKKSILKRIRQTAKRTARARALRSRLRNQIKDLRRALDAKDLAQAKGLLRETISVIDWAVRKGILHSNAAARHKSRLTSRFQALSAPGSAASAPAKA